MARPILQPINEERSFARLCPSMAYTNVYICYHKIKDNTVTNATVAAKVTK